MATDNDSNRRVDAVDPILLGVTAVLCLFGLMMVYSSSAVISIGAYGDSTRIAFKQLIALAIGIGAAIALCSFDYRRLRDPRVVYGSLAVTLAMLGTVLLLPAVRNTRRWIRVGGFSFEPSELAKLAIVVFLAYMLEKKRERINDFIYTLAPIGIVVLTFAVFIVVEPDFGTAMAVLTVAFVLLFAAGLSWGYVTGAAAMLIPTAAVLVLIAPYRLKRMFAFLSPWSDPQGAGFQPIQALIAAGSGGLFGLGPGESVQKMYYLPEPHTDFIFAVIAEELGLVGAVALLAIYLLWTWRGVRAALRADNDFGFYLATGITALVTIQVLVNISVALSLLPTKGLPLPFVSAGGSSLIICLAGTGLLLNVSSRH